VEFYKPGTKSARHCRDNNKSLRAKNSLLFFAGFVDRKIATSPAQNQHGIAVIIIKAFGLRTLSSSSLGLLTRK